MKLLSVDRLLFSPCTLIDAKVSVSCKGRIVLKLIVPPTDPSIVLASGAFVTSTAAIIAAETSSKLMPLRPAPDPTVDTPFISVRFALVPRICTPVPTPASRVIWIPVIFSSTSAKFWSGSLPISSAFITSINLSEVRVSASALESDLLIPVTSITSTFCSASGVTSCACTDEVTLSAAADNSAKVILESLCSMCCVPCVCDSVFKLDSSNFVMNNIALRN